MEPFHVNLLVVFAVSIVPGLLWVSFFYKKDIYEPEPKRLILRSFIYGSLMVFPAALVELPFRNIVKEAPGNLVNLLLVSVFVVGVAEESFKYLAVRLSAYDSPEFNEVMDGIIYSVSAGLGFAALENLFYAASFGLAVGAFRAFVTSLAHASFSGVQGYYLGRSKFEQADAGGLILKGLIVAIILHGIYDFLIIGQLLPPILGIAMVVLLYWYLGKKIAIAEDVSPFKKE